MANKRQVKCAAGIRDALIQSIAESKTKRPYVFLSGGVDSNTILFAAIEAGCKPIGLSFHMEDNLSRDFRAAQATADEYGIELIEVILPKSIEKLKKDVILMADRYSCQQKNEFECGWPMLYSFFKVGKHARANGIKNPATYTGQGSDALHLSSKKANIHYKDRPDEWRELCFANPFRTQGRILPAIARDAGVRNFKPWNEPQFLDIFRGTSWEDVNKPRQKECARAAFEDHFKRIRVFNHTNYQLGDSGIASHFECLLDDPDFNPDGRYKSVTGVYNELARRFAKD